MSYLLIIIMAVCRNYENHDFCIMNLIHKPVFSGNTSAPFTRTITRERFRFSSTCMWVKHPLEVYQG